jgi:hypothetical protein
MGLSKKAGGQLLAQAHSQCGILGGQNVLNKR